LRIVLDVEANSLIKPTKVWCIVCKDIDTGETYVFKEPSDRPEEKARFLALAEGTTLWVGHNWLEYDYPVLHDLLGLTVDEVADKSIDTLIVSRLVNYSRNSSTKISEGLDGAPHVAFKGHSIESYGEEFGLPKIKFSDFTRYSQEQEDYCARDVEITHRIYLKYLDIINDKRWKPSILMEHRFQLVVNDLHNNGFSFNSSKANTLLDRVTKELGELDAKITEAFPTRQIKVREFTPKATKFGTISKTSVPRSLWSKISDYEVGQTYPVYQDHTFNPSSHKQLIEVLHEAGWKPTDKTKTHIDFDRQRTEKVDTKNLLKYGWKINENNLTTLPSTAPPSSRLLAKRILLESRRRTLTEWLNLVSPDGRIRGRFLGIGAWTHRMAHQRPNTANIPNEYDTQGKKKLLGKEMRSLWCAPKGRLLVGVDAEGIQLRIFAHYIDDPEFTDALVKGRKDDGTDPHSLNKRILGSVCKSRAAAKRFIYALLLGAGLRKLSQILECSEADTQEALDRLLKHYIGWAKLKDTDIPRDARRGYFVGLDNRKVAIPGESPGERRHLAMSGYLQNGEAVVMKRATLKWYPEVCHANVERPTQGSEGSSQPLSKYRQSNILVNFVHDEWQTETPNNMVEALRVAEAQCRALREVGEDLGLKCPLAGSYWNDDYKDYTVGSNWSVTH
jgi:DNA polymerase-1